MNGAPYKCSCVEIPCYVKILFTLVFYVYADSTTDSKMICGTDKLINCMEV